MLTFGVSVVALMLLTTFISSQKVLSMLIAPFIVQYSEKLVMRFVAGEWLLRSMQLTKIAAQSMGTEKHAIICGFGRSGQYLARFLGQMKEPLVLVLIVGKGTLGAKRWIPLGPLQFQPAEAAKGLIIMRWAVADLEQVVTDLVGSQILDANLVVHAGLPVQVDSVFVVKDIGRTRCCIWPRSRTWIAPLTRREPSSTPTAAPEPGTSTRR